MHPFPKTVLLAATSLFFVQFATAQISLDDVPDTQGNSRFFSDEISQVTHPSLTLDGFDSGPENGLGLKQVLEERYSSNPDESLLRAYDEMARLASNDSDFHPSPSNQQGNGHDQIKANAQRMQARAFVALATYVIEQNGEGQVLSNVPANVDAPGKVAGLR